MSVVTVTPSTVRGSGGQVVRRGGSLAARRAVVRWAWRLFRREWRQQLLVLALVVVAVAATVVGSAVASDSPPPASAGFGTAQDMATFSGADPHVAAQLGTLRHLVGPVDVVVNQKLAVPGSVDTFDLRAENPDGPFGRPLLQLLSGRYPTSAGQVALTPGLASELGLGIGDVWHQGGTSRRVVGLVQNPQSLLDAFALVPSGQVPVSAASSSVVVLFDAGRAHLGSLSSDVTTASSLSGGNAFNPETVSLAVLTIGMLLIALVAVGGFTVLAQRRLRSLGMLATVGATDRQVSLVVRANGAVVGLAGALIGLVLGFAAWLLYRPHLEASAHHVIGMWALPWTVVVLAVVLAMVATYFAASRPARAVVRMPIVAALSGRPPPPRQIRRSAVPGLVLVVIAFVVLGLSGSQNGDGGGAPELVVGLVLLVPGVILLAPFCLSALARVGRRAPVAVRLAFRDLARYRARSGSALSAISIGVMIAVIISVVAAARYGDVLDYAGPNVAANQLILYTPGSGDVAGPPGPPSGAGQTASTSRTAHDIGASVGAQHVIELDTTSANLDYTGTGRQWNGAIYVATPQLLRAFGIPRSRIQPSADVLTARPGLSGISGLQLTWSLPDKGGGSVTHVGPGTSGGGGPGGPGPTGPGGGTPPCTRAHQCLADPVIQEMSALPAGTSAPNTLITEHAVRSLGLASSLGTSGWLVETAQPLTASQIRNAQSAASSAGLSLESKNDEPTSAEVINWATVFGVTLSLCILAMSVGLIRSETAGDLRTLAATGASNRTRRTLTAATAGGLGLLGALLGTFAGYVGVLGWLSQNSLDGPSSLDNVPLANLLVILVGLPVAAAVVGWLLAGREPAAISRQPIG
jgi:putative ABC transport system permease protein